MEKVQNVGTKRAFTQKKKKDQTQRERKKKKKKRDQTEFDYSLTVDPSNMCVFTKMSS